MSPYTKRALARKPTYAEWQPIYAAHGVPTVPLKDKKPAVKHPQRFGLSGSAELTRKFADCSEIGFIAGARSKITLCDIDTTDERVLADALDRHGQTPLVVRTASRKWHAYYRHNGERRRIRPWPNLPIDLIGGGLAVAPPTSTARGSYEIIAGSLDDLDRLPVMRGVEQLGRAPVGTGEPILDGQRNEKLFRWCLQQARHCDDLDALLDVARTRNANLFPPLEDEEVMRVAQSAWSYEERGLNRCGQYGFWSPLNQVVEFLGDPDAFYLLAFLRAHNGPWSHFMCANGLAEKFGWDRRRLAAARTRLIEAGHIKYVRYAGKGQPAMFTWK
jgi:Bifunctional DNA primase/polymerase, N-terminal/Primase C terminal 1 (PriCT-1)